MPSLQATTCVDGIVSGKVRRALSTLPTCLENDLSKGDFTIRSNNLSDQVHQPAPTSSKEPITPSATSDSATPTSKSEEKEYHAPIVWPNVAFWLIAHCVGGYGIYLLPYCRIQTLLFTVFLDVLGGLGVTAGAHRLWSHRSYKAKFPLRLLLVIGQTMTFQNHLIEWCRDHRVHHKYSETNADPHNALRGFFFAHMGWLMVRKHPEVRSKGRDIDISDLYADPLLRFQKRHIITLTLFFIFLHTIIPMYFWDETFLNAYCVAAVLRLLFTLHMTWLVNSAAHMWGNRPYDESINPSENMLVTLGALGEGFHNYHHTFPQDYATSEFGMKFNLTTAFIRLMAWLGQAYDLKTMTKEAVLARRRRTGDLKGTPHHGEEADPEEYTIETSKSK